LFFGSNIFYINNEFKEKKMLTNSLYLRLCPSILIQGPQRGCSEHRFFGVSIATATKLPLQRPPEGCVSTFHPLSRPIKSYHACNRPERKRCRLLSRRLLSLSKLKNNCY